jgi:hypothetical protein
MAESGGVSDALQPGKQRRSMVFESGSQSPSDREIFAAEFNQSQYIFKVKDVHSLGKQLRIQQFKRIMEKAEENDLSPSSPIRSRVRSNIRSQVNGSSEVESELKPIPVISNGQDSSDLSLEGNKRASLIVPNQSHHSQIDRPSH